MLLVLALFDNVRTSLEALNADFGAFGVMVTMHLVGTLVIATPATLWVLRRNPKNRAWIVKLLVAGIIGGALLVPVTPVFGALAGLNAAMIWCGIAVLLFKKNSSAEIASA